MTGIKLKTTQGSPSNDQTSTFYPLYIRMSSYYIGISPQKWQFLKQF